MKKVLFLLWVLLSAALQAQNQTLMFYPSLGVDMGATIPFPLSDIPEGASAAPKLNLSFGVGMEYGTPGRWNFDLGICYHTLEFAASADVRSQPFYTFSDILYFSGHTVTDLKINLLEFPLSAIYKLGKKNALLLGTYYSRILHGTFTTQGTHGVLSDDKTITDAALLPGEVNTRYNFNDYIDKWDAGLHIGYRRNFIHNFNLYCSLKVGLKSIFVHEFYNIDYELYQVRLNLGITKYLF
jgi:hypothetical protein